MMHYENLPIYRSAVNLCVYIETIVKSFDKYNKYTIGNDLRKNSKQILFLIHHTNVAMDKNIKLVELRDKCEETKMLIYLAKELKAFKSFTQFEHTSKLLVDICKQAQAWLNHYARVVK